MDKIVDGGQGVFVVAPQGDLDAAANTLFQAQADARLEVGASRFVIDLGEVEFLASAGLWALVRLNTRVRTAKGQLCLARVPSAVQTVFNLTHVGEFFEIHPDVRTALA